MAQPVFDRLKHDVDGYTWMLESLTLTPADRGNPGESFTNDRWTWVVKYLHYPDNGGGVLPEIQLIVLMDRTVVEPKKRPPNKTDGGSAKLTNHDDYEVLGLTSGDYFHQQRICAADGCAVGDSVGRFLEPS